MEHWSTAIGGEPRVAGVLADTAFSHPKEVVPPMLFNPSASTARMDSLLLHTQLSPAEVRNSLTRLTDTGEIDLDIKDVYRLRDRWHEGMAADLARTRLTAAAAVMVILLTGFGFYGTQRYLVAAGRREYAILASVGAGPRALFKTVLIRGLMMGLPGLVLGVLLAYIAAAYFKDGAADAGIDRKSTRLNSSHVAISYAVFCLKKKKILRVIIQLFNLSKDSEVVSVASTFSLK